MPKLKISKFDDSRMMMRDRATKWLKKVAKQKSNDTDLQQYRFEQGSFGAANKGRCLSAKEKTKIEQELRDRKIL